jgi:uncharacterized protein YndB with AHSA1/START domain
MKRKVTFVMDYGHPPDRVWRALTDPAEMAQWLMANDFEPRVGHRFRFRAKPQPGWRGIVDGEVLEVDPPRRLSYSWTGDPSWKRPTRVTWTLVPSGGGTRLTLEHDGFEGIGGVLLSYMMGSGWRRMLRGKLAAVLDRLAAVPA